MAEKWEFPDVYITDLFVVEQQPIESIDLTQFFRK